MAAREGEHVARRQLAPLAVACGRSGARAGRRAAPPRPGGSGTDRRPRRARSPRCSRRGAPSRAPSRARARSARKPGCSRRWLKSGSKMFGMAHRFAPSPPDPLPVVKCGHDDSTRLRSPPRPAGPRRARAAWGRARRLRRLGKAGAVAGAAGTDGRAAQAFPASTVAFADANIDEQLRRLEAPAGAGRALPELAQARDRVQQVRQPGHRRRPDARAGALLARLRGRGRRARRARPTARTRRCSASPRCATAAASRARSRRRRTCRPPGRTAASTSSRTPRARPSSAVSDDTALVANSQAGGERRDRPPRFLQRPPVGLRRLQGHAGDACRATTSSSATRRARRCRSSSRSRRPGGPRPRRGRCRRLRWTRSRRSSPASAASASRSARPTRACALRGTTLLNGYASGLPEAFSPDLLSRVPANSWFAASFGNLDASIKQAADQAPQDQPGGAAAGLAGRGRCSASSWTTSTRCSRATRPSTPGRALRSRRG